MLHDLSLICSLVDYNRLFEPMQSKEIEIKSCFEHLLSAFSFCVGVCHLVNLKLGSLAFSALQKIGDENFVPGTS